MANQSVQRAAETAGLVFVGTVDRANASAVAAAPADEHTAIVRIERIVRAPQVLGLVPGKTLTLRSSNGPPREGERALFVADPWLYAESVAVLERARIPLNGGTVEEAKAMDEDLSAIELAPLRARVREADVVVVGSVAKLGPLERKQHPDSEHDPMWWQAEITVETPLKGRAPAKTVKLVFPTSTDVVWYGWPRPTPNQSAVFLLHKSDHPEAKGAFCAPHPLDIQPAGRAEHVRELVGQTKRGG
jgi:hypothetical protein